MTLMNSNKRPIYSLIIPTYNEEKNIRPTLESILNQKGDYEIIISDGGSSDRTREIAESLGARVLEAPKGRGHQCHFAAHRAGGGILIFLHADTRFPRNGFALLEKHFENGDHQAALFKMAFDRSSPFLNFYSRLTRRDSLFTSFGDRGLVIRKAFYNSIGGHPPWPIFEDVRILQKARKRGPLKILPARVITSARMFEQKGHLFQMLRNIYLFLRYLTGTPVSIIYKQYYKNFKQGGKKKSPRGAGKNPGAEPKK